MRIALAQINTTVGDFTGNIAKIIRYSEQARSQGAGLAVFPELSVCGYPPRDLVEKSSFVERNRTALEEITARTRGIAVICGYVTSSKVEAGKPVRNAAVLLKDGRIAFEQHKMLLPTYDVFDELRHFEPAERQALLPFCGNQMALTICEDAWNDKQFWRKRLYDVDPVEELMRAGGNFIVNISASPFCMGKREIRREMLATIARRYNAPVAIANQVGGNDSLIFDGSSMVLDRHGNVVAQAASFEEDVIFFDSEKLTGDIHAQVEGEEATALAALVMGTRDYVHKCGFRKVLIGLSGGIDSALVAAIAVEALGADHVTGVAMPGPYSSTHSVEDARELADNLGIRFEIVPIHAPFDALRNTLQPVFAGLPEDVTEENLQSRCRGMILMALSNKFGAMVLNTGNKSEMAVGYCTLYGDLAGGLGVISDLPKTMVYRLAGHLNSVRPLIPQNTMDKPPSAELRPGQKDTDSLPEYDVLDPIIEDYVEDMKSASEIARERGLDEKLVRRIIRLTESSEYKRQQAPPGLKISQKAFGMGRRYPIAAKYQD